MQGWASQDDGDAGPLLEVGSEFLLGKPGAPAAELDGGWRSPGIRAYPPQQPAIYETVSQLSLADSPIKQQQPPPAAARSVPAAPAAHRGSLGFGGGEAALAMLSPAAQRDNELEEENVALRRRVEELQAKLAAAERAPVLPSPFGPAEADVRELQRSLTVRQREAAAAQEAAGLARGEAKRTAALLQQERDRSAGLQDEVAQWRDEYTQAKRECDALKKKLEALSAQGSLLDSSAGALRRQNADLSKALEEKDAACRELGDRLAALQGGEGSRHNRMQQLLDQIEALSSENATLQQRLHDASEDACSMHGQMQQLWEEREALRSENAALRQQVEQLNLELHQAAEALSAARGQLRARRSSGDSSTLAGSRGSFGAPISQAQGQLFGAYTQQAAAVVPGAWQQRPSTTSMAGSQQPNRPWDVVQPSGTVGLARFDYGGTQQQEPEQHWQPHSTARYSEQWEQQQQQQQQHSTHTARPQAAAEQEWLGEAAMPPHAQRSLRFYEQHADSMAAAPDRSPVDAAGGFNPRASLPQPYHPSRSASPEVAAAPVLGVQDFYRGPGSGPAGTEPVLAGGLQPRPRLGSVDDASGSTPAPGGQRMQVAGTPQSPFGSEVTLQEMLARTQALEDRLMRLQQEKNEVEAELARVPTNNPGRKLQDRRRKGELEQRLEVVNREVSAIRLQLKKMGYK